MGQAGSRGTVALSIAAALCLLAGGVGTYARHAVLDERAFADRAARTLESDEVRSEAAVRIAARVVADRPQLWGSEPLLRSALEDAVVGRAEFHGAFRAGAGRLHHALFEDRDAEASLTVAGTGAALRAELVRRSPALARRLPALGDPPLLTVGYGAGERSLRDAAPAARALTAAAPGALALAVLLLAVAALRGPDRRRGVWVAGLTVAAAGGLTVAGVTAAGDLALQQFDTSFGDAVVGAVWRAYLGELRTWGLLAGAAGLVIAATAGGPRLDVRALLAAPASRSARAARALGLLALAATAIALPELVLHVGLVALAAALAYAAAVELLAAVRPAPRARRAEPLRAGAASPAGSSTSSPR